MSMRIACHGITWGRYGFATAIQEISALGFTGFEAFAFVVDDFGFERLDAFKQALYERQTEARSPVRRRRFCTSRIASRSWSHSMYISPASWRPTVPTGWCWARAGVRPAVPAATIC